MNQYRRSKEDNNDMVNSRTNVQWLWKNYFNNCKKKQHIHMQNVALSKVQHVS